MSGRKCPYVISSRTTFEPRTANRPLRKNEDNWKYRLGIELNLPPLHRLEDIFDDLTTKAVKLGLDKVVEHLQGRKLKVVTMCSGTESPMLALGLIRDSEDIPIPLPGTR